jgi:hypothetical protein
MNTEDDARRVAYATAVVPRAAASTAPVSRVIIWTS